MKLLIDTNIIVDVALDRDPFFTNSEQVLARVEQQEIQGYLSASTFSDLYYIIRKVKGQQEAGGRGLSSRGETPSMNGGA